MINHFKEMPVWKEAFRISLIVHDLTKTFPKCEDYGLTSQMRRAAVSTFSNISEGFGRMGNHDKRKYYIISRGSMMELEGQLLYAVKVEYITIDQANRIHSLLPDWYYSINKLIKSMG